jgi:hydrophobic/amphiphilic exporter-1 (mainly G- bacteria), HAE1 family
MSWLTRVSLRNRSVVALAVVGVLVVGFFAMSRLRQELMPSIEYPALTVFTMQPGASPADVERGVTIPLETSMKGLVGLKELDSYSNEGVSIIVGLFDYGTDMTAMQATAQQATQHVQALLPTGSQPQVKALNFGDFPIIQLAVSSPLPPEQLASLLQQKAVPRLLQVPGVADVSLSGVQGSQLQIALKPLALVKYGVGVPAVISALKSANVSMPAGTLSSNGESIPVRVTSEAAGVEALKALPVQAGTAAMGATGQGAPGAAASAAVTPIFPRPTNVPVTLGDVADIQVVPTPASSITRTNGRPSVGIAISKAGSGNVVDISKEVAALLPALQADLGTGSSITVVVDQAPYITQSISSMWREGLIGAVFAILVILLFLRSWRSTVVAGMSIPLSVIIALIVLWGRGNSLNMLTLAGLTIAIGRVIDDSIVVLENSYRHIQEGDDAMTAAEKGTREVSLAVTASTLTTVAVFLPLGFVHGIASEFFRPFALTVSFALLASLLVALTVVPVGVTWLLSRGHVPRKEKDDITTLQRAYLPVLRWATSHKIITVVAAVAIFAGSMALVPQLKTNLLDNSQQNSLSLTQQLPPGTETAITAEAAAKVEEVLAKTSGVGTYQVTIGSTGGLFGPGGGTEASSSRAEFSVTTEGTRPKADIVADLRRQAAALQGAGEVAVTDSDSSMGNNSLLQVRVYADDPAVLQQANVVVVRALSGVPDLTNISSNLSENRPQIAVKVDPAKVAASGLDAAQVGQYVALVLNGMPIGQLPTEQGPIPAVLTLPLLAQGGSAQLGDLPLPGGTGLTTLSSIAAVNQTKEPVQITHTDGSRTVTISATATSNNVGATATAVKTALKDIKLPAGARWQMAGASEQMGDVFTSLGVAMLVAILLVYLIMVATFRSLLNPLILLVSIPFAAVGAVLLLFVTGTSLGMPSLIGLLMLIGIVVTNAIVLLDLIEQFRDRGMDAPTAVVEGARRRLRPILMTAVATILALAPMALGLGKGSFLSGPLAVVVIGGLVSSTLLTLVLVPVVYLSLDRLRRRPVVRPPATV